MPHKEMSLQKQIILSGLIFILWLALYQGITPFASWFTFTLLELEPSSALGTSLSFFIYDVGKIFLLLVFMVYVIGFLRASLNTEKVRDYLQGKARVLGYLTGSGFGAITPFCSCSSIPLFIAFTSARIPLGITMAFLITSPLINEVAVVLLWGLLGWKFTLLYVSLGLLAGITGGFIIDFLKCEKWLQPFLLKPALTPMGISLKTTRKITPYERHIFGKNETINIVKKVWLWILIGVAVGAALHGYVPQEWFEKYLNNASWWSVPLAVLIGIPLYTNVTGIIPIMESLILKGVPIGTVMAFSMSTVAASLPEILMLKQVMRPQLLGIFLGILLVFFTLMGWIFNFIF